MPRGPADARPADRRALVPATLHYDGDRLCITFHPPVPHATATTDREMMQGVADAFGRRDLRATRRTGT